MGEENKQNVSFETELYVSVKIKKIRDIENKIKKGLRIENLSISEIKEYMEYLQGIREEYLELLLKIEKHLISGA